MPLRRHRIQTMIKRSRTMRLDRLLALRGLGTRSEVRGLLRAGRVFVNGVPARDAGFLLDPEKEAVVVDGKPVLYRSSLHIMLNKPAGILTAARDPKRRTVLDLLPPACAAQGCMPVGRLDLDTEGLLLFTTDGQLAHRLLSPKRHVDKVYRAETDAPLTDRDVAAFAQGLALSDFIALPARLTILPGGMIGEVTVQEGKFHQVRRMFAACGKRVNRLTRLSFGGIVLDPALAPGAWRELTEGELTQLTEVSGGHTDG